MDEIKAANVEKETPAPESAPVQETTQASTPSAEVVKEPANEPVDTRLDKHPRFKEVIFKKNELERKVQELQRKYDEAVSKTAPHEVDPFAELLPEEREQTQKFISKFVEPTIRKSLMAEMAPFMQEVQNEKLNKQINEAKALSSKVGINFDERLPEIVDFLSRPENKGRLTAKEALMSLYSDEILTSAMSKGKDELSKETKELIEKKKIANTSIQQVNPNVAVQSDELALKGMNSNERISYGIKKAMEMGKQGIKSNKVRFE
ncbi:MAG: hypothetical protein ABID54_08940 [Pseudomonadota bacterium]